MYLQPLARNISIKKVTIDTSQRNKVGSICVRKYTPIGKPIIAPTTSKDTSAGSPSRQALGSKAKGPNISNDIIIIIAHIGLVTEAAIGIKINAVPKPTNPRTNPANITVIINQTNPSNDRVCSIIDIMHQCQQTECQLYRH